MLILSALAVVLLGEGALRVAAPHLPEPLQWYNPLAARRVELLEERRRGGDAPDVVFLGSSSVAGGLDPWAFEENDACGRTAFNAGTPGGTPELLARWLDDAVLARSDPELVVLGFTSRDLAVRGDKHVIEAYVQSIAARRDLMAGIEREVADVAYLVRYRAVLRDPLRMWRYAGGMRTPDEARAEKLDASGFNHERVREPYKHVSKSQIGLIHNYRIDRAEVDHVDEMLAELSRLGIRVAIVAMPVSPEWIPEHGNGEADYARFRAVLHELASDNDATVIDLTDIGDESLFVDPIHLAPDGAVLATGQLVDGLGEACGADRGEQGGDDA